MSKSPTNNSDIAVGVTYERLRMVSLSNQT